MKRVTKNSASKNGFVIPFSAPPECFEHIGDVANRVIDGLNLSGFSSSTPGDRFPFSRPDSSFLQARQDQGNLPRVSRGRRRQ